METMKTFAKILRRLGATLIVLLVMLLIPGKALAADYRVWIQGTQITDANKSNVLGDGKVSFDPTTNILTLNNATVTGAPIPAMPGQTAAIYSMVDLTIKMVGESTVTGTNATEFSWGIMVMSYTYDDPRAAITFTGEGILNVTGGVGGYACGIFGDGITLESGTVNTTGGGPYEYLSSVGIYSMKEPLTLKGGTLVATGGDGGHSSGVYLDNSTLKMEGGTLIAKGGAHPPGDSAGIRLNGSRFIMTGGTVEAVSGTGGEINVGLHNYAGSTATITGGTLTLRGTDRGTMIPLNIDDYPNPGVIVADNPDSSNPEIWNTTTPLDDEGFKFVKIQPSQPVPATVSFDSNGGVGTMGDIGTFVGLTVTLPESTFTPPGGKVFKSWKPELDSTEYNPGDKITVNGNVDIVAQWRDPIPYDVWVGGTRITELNKGDVKGDGTVSFDPTTNTLTLNNATVTGALTPDNTGNTAGIYTKVDLTIEMAGESIVTGKDASGDSWGIGVPGDLADPRNSLTFRGTGTLTVTGGKGSFCVGIFGKGITLESGTIITTGGESITGWTSAGIYSSDTPLTMKGGSLTVTGGKGHYSIGVGLSFGAVLNMEGGTLIAKGGESTRFFSAGINLSGSSFTMTGGTVEAVGGTGGTSNGLNSEWGDNTATITGGTLTLRGTGRGTNIPVNITGYPNPGVIVADNAENNNPEIWNTTTPLNNASFKFVKIQPGQPVPATVSFNPNGGLGAMEASGPS